MRAEIRKEPCVSAPLWDSVSSNVKKVVELDAFPAPHFITEYPAR